MALKKALDIEGGINVANAYHRIVHFDADALGKTLKVEIAIYKDAATRDAGEENFIPRATKIITIINDPEVPHTDFNIFFTTARAAGSLQTSIYAAMYTYVKANNAYYSDAVDV